MDKEMQIRIALSYMGKAKAASTFEEAEENMKKHVETMANIYHQDKTDDRIAKGYMSSLGQISLFYEQAGRIENGLEYSLQAFEIGKYLYEKNPQQFDYAIGYSVSCISVSKIYLKLRDAEKIKKYFDVAKQLLQQLQVKHPEDDMVGSYVAIKNDLDKEIDALLASKQKSESSYGTSSNKEARNGESKKREDNSQQNQRGKIVAIVMMVFLFGMISFVTNLAAPMGVVLKNQFGATNAMGMMGNMANFIAYAVMGIPGGLLLQKRGYKKTALIAVAIGFIGVLIQYLSGHAASFGVYLLGAFVAGFSMCLLNMVVNPMLNTLGGGGNKGNQLIQMGGSFNSLCGTMVPILVGALVGEVTKANITDVYPVMYIAMTIFGLVFIVLNIVAIPEPHLVKSDEPIGALINGVLRFRHFVLGAIAIFVYVGVEIGTAGTMNLFLADPAAGGLDATTAGFVAGTYWFLMLCGRLLGASLGGKVSSRAMLATVSTVGLLLVLCAIFTSTAIRVSIPVFQTSAAGNLPFEMEQVPINAMFLVLVGLCTSIMWGSIFNLAVEGLGKYIAAASGIFMVLVCGGGIVPAIQGYVADVAGYMPSYWVIVVCLTFLLYYALIGSKNVNRDIPVD